MDFSVIQVLEFGRSVAVILGTILDVCLFGGGVYPQVRWSRKIVQYDHLFLGLK
jgi:hypothetical protein